MSRPDPFPWMRPSTSDSQIDQAPLGVPTPVASRSFIGRQPIYDRRLRVIGYELLFRPHPGALAAGKVQDEQATAQVLVNTFVEMGIDAVAGSYQAFVNFSRSLLLQDYARALPPGRVVLEVLETVTVDDELRRAILSLAQAGYRIALDDFTDQPHLRLLLELADIVKVDLPGMSRREWPRRVAELRKYSVKLLAEKVETRKDFEICKELGFDYFQGYFLRRPEIVEGNRTPTLRVSVVRLLQKLCDPHVALPELEKVMRNDVSLSYKLLRLANSALVANRVTINSLHQALQVVGLETVTIWVSLILLSGMSDKPRDVLHAAILRANMCEYLAAPVAPRWANSFFLVGLFSVLDILLDRPMCEVVPGLALGPEIEQALVSREGVLGETLQIVLDYEQGRWDKLAGNRLDHSSIVQAYLEAIAATERIAPILGQIS